MDVADTDTNAIRAVMSKGSVRAVAGSGNAGYVDGVGTNAMFNQRDGVVRDGMSRMILHW